MSQIDVDFLEYYTLQVRFFINFKFTYFEDKATLFVIYANGSSFNFVFILLAPTFFKKSRIFLQVYYLIIVTYHHFVYKPYRVWAF